MCAFQSRVSVRSAKEGRKSSSLKLQDEAEDHSESIMEGVTSSGEAEGWNHRNIHKTLTLAGRPSFYNLSKNSFYIL